MTRGSITVKSARATAAGFAAAGLAVMVAATASATAPASGPPTPASGQTRTEPRVASAQEYIGRGVAPLRDRAVALAKVDAFARAGADGQDLSTCVEARPPVVVPGGIVPPHVPLPIGSRVWTAQYFLRCGGPDIPPPRVPEDPGVVDLVRYRIPDSASYASHVEPMPNPPYVRDKLLGQLLVEPATGTHALYRCQVGWNPPRTTTDPNEGDCTRLGLAHDAQQPGTVPLYRCPVPELGRYGSMDSTDPGCEGRTNPKLPDRQPALLGYLGSLFVPV